MPITLDWSTSYPGMIDTIATNFPVLANDTYVVRASHVNELAKAVVALENAVAAVGVTWKNGVTVLTVRAFSATDDATLIASDDGTNINIKVKDGGIGDTQISSSIKDPVAGTAGLRTLGTGAQQAAAGNDSRLSDARTPTGTAGGALTGTYPNPSLGSSVVTGSNINSSLIDPVAGTAGLRTLGTGAQQATAGNDSRLSDSRAPNGSASGDLGGTYPSPTVAAIHETSGPTKLTIGSISNGQVLVRSGSTIVGTTVTTSAVRYALAGSTGVFVGADQLGVPTIVGGFTYDPTSDTGVTISYQVLVNSTASVTAELYDVTAFPAVKRATITASPTNNYISSSTTLTPTGSPGTNVGQISSSAANYEIRVTPTAVATVLWIGLKVG